MAPLDAAMLKTMTPVLCSDELAFQDANSEVLAEVAEHNNIKIQTQFSPQSQRSPNGLDRFSSMSNKVAFSNSSNNKKRGGMRPQSTMQMLSDAVYRREVARLSSASSTSSKVQQRPYSADMAVQLRSTFNPYETSYKHEYYRKDSEERYGRPPSLIKLSSAPLRDETTYKKEFTGLRTTPNAKLWTGGNNPHPSQAFMVWKYPTRKDQIPREDNSTSAPSLTNDKFDKVMRGKCRSTYQVDYKGLPPGFMPTEYINAEKDWKSSIPYTLDSSQRVSYQLPNQPKPLSNKTDRFGHSTNDRHRLLVGIAPNASQRRATVNNKTTYHRHYNEMSPSIQQAAAVHFPTHARTVVKGKGPEELSALYEDIKRQYFPRHARAPAANSPLNGYSNEVPIVAPDSGVPVVSPGAGIVPIPGPSFITTPVPEPICEPV